MPAKKPLGKWRMPAKEDIEAPRAKRSSKQEPVATCAKNARREKKEEQLTRKIEETRAELKDDGHIALAPAMITLPEFEEERMALMAEEHDILVGTG